MNTWVYWEQLLPAKRDRCFSLPWMVYFCICLPEHCKLLILPILSGEYLDQWLALSLAQQPGRAAALCVWGGLLQPSGEMFSADASYLSFCKIFIFPLFKTTISCSVVYQDTQWEYSCKGERRREQQRFSLQAGKQTGGAQGKKVISCLRILENSSVGNHLANGCYQLLWLNWIMSYLEFIYYNRNILYPDKVHQVSHSFGGSYSKHARVALLTDSSVCRCLEDCNFLSPVRNGRSIAKAYASA